MGAYSNNNEIILKDMAAGGTFRIEVRVKTTDGSSAYSVPTIASTPLNKTELDQFRDSLNLPDIEKRLEGLGTTLDGKIATLTTSATTLQTLVNEIDERTTSIEN